MKRASRIMLTISGVFGYVIFGLLVLCGIVFAILALPPITNAMTNAAEQNSTTPFNASDAALALTIVFATYSVVFFMISVLELLAAIFAFKAKKQETKGLYITAIVFGALSGLEVMIPGGILGICALNKEAKTQTLEPLE